MEAGLLFKESPEPRAELYCYECIMNFFTVYEYQQHRKKVHNTVYLLCWNGYSFYGHWMDLTYDKELTSDAVINDRGQFIEKPWKSLARPTQRCKATQRELKNLREKKCWCGKERKDFLKHQRKYCTPKHASIWWSRNLSVGDHRNKYLYKHNNKCDKCGKKHESSYSMEMDHIIAIALGGHPWDYRNLQALCIECHSKKTKSDIKILTWWKKQANYDTGPIVIEEQTKLEIYI